ncbi:PAS domain S-box protein [Roseiflexus sp.]|uniref:PAS domain-containing protein n=1 Tax=Roseiflexus sp. TaxID=2562120 RepID=UPI0025CDDFDD|nr:PAS domain S-box protein [Roseiflexus sp.]
MLRTTGHTGAFNEFQGFRTTVERASQGIVIVHLEGVITYVNSAFCALTGYPCTCRQAYKHALFRVRSPITGQGLAESQVRWRLAGQHLVAPQRWRCYTGAYRRFSHL